HQTYTLSLHDALPILGRFKIITHGTNLARLEQFLLLFLRTRPPGRHGISVAHKESVSREPERICGYLDTSAVSQQCDTAVRPTPDRKSTRLNSSHVSI